MSDEKKREIKNIVIHKAYDIVRDRRIMRIDIRWTKKKWVLVTLHSRMSRKSVVAGLRNLADKLAE